MYAYQVTYTSQLIFFMSRNKKRWYLPYKKVTQGLCRQTPGEHNIIKFISLIHVFCLKEIIKPDNWVSSVAARKWDVKKIKTAVDGFPQIFTISPSHRSSSSHGHSQIFFSVFCRFCLNISLRIDHPLIFYLGISSSRRQKQRLGIIGD